MPPFSVTSGSAVANAAWCIRGLAVALLVLVLDGCESPTAPLSIPRGHYELVRLAGVPTPAEMPCGNATLVESSLILGPDSAAAFTIRMDLAGQPSLAFVGTGTFREEAGTILIRVKGRWTNLPEHGVVTIPFAFTIVGGELHRYVGMECDGYHPTEYVLQAPF